MASVIYVTNSNVSVQASSQIPLATISHKTCGNTLNLQNNAIAINSSGYYRIDVTATFSVPTAGNVTIGLYQNGTPLITGTETITTATTEVRTITLCTEAYVRCNCGALITLQNLGVATDFSAIAISVKRDG